MEVLAVATTVCSLCNRILTWIDQLSEKELLVRDISSSVLQIRNILFPLTSTTKFEGTGEQQLSQSIRSVGDVLRRIEEHLLLYRSKKTQQVFAFLKPNSFILKLREDQRQLGHQLVVLLAAIAVVGYFRDHDRDGQAQVALTQKLEISNDSDTLEMGTINGISELQAAVDAQEFWKDYIGVKVDVVANDLFCARLVSWSNGDLSKNICDLIIMRLDEFNCGVVTPQNLARALGNESLKSFVETYKRNEYPSQDMKLPSEEAPQSQLRVPLLVWVDDRPENNYFEICKAQQMGIQVIALSSTAAAKVWVDENAAFLHEHDDPSYIRFISDNVRMETISESDAGEYLNANAGQNFLQYLRGRLFSAPVLIYTCTTIHMTGFVTNYGSAGSTTDASICLDYIASLAGGLNTDSGWKGFKAEAHRCWIM